MQFDGCHHRYQFVNDDVGDGAVNVEEKMSMHHSIENYQISFINFEIFAVEMCLTSSFFRWVEAKCAIAIANDSQYFKATVTLALYAVIYEI